MGRDRLRARAKRFGDRPFIVGRSKRLKTVTNVLRRRIAKAFEPVGDFEENPHATSFPPHVRTNAPGKGVPLADVADLFGDDEKTVRTFWRMATPCRHARKAHRLHHALKS